MGKSKDFLISIGIGLAAAVAAGLVALIPLLDVVVILVPAPFILLALRRGYWTGIAGVLTFCLAYTILGGPLVGGILLLLTGFLAAGVPVLLRRQRSYMEYLLYAAGLTLVSLVAIMAAYALIAGESLFTAFVAAAERFLTDNQQMFTPVLDAYRQIGLLDTDAATGDLIALMVASLKDMAPFVPAFLLIASALIGVLNLMIPYRMAVRKGVEMPLIPPFSRWRLPRGTFLGFLAIGLVSYLLTLANGPMGQTVLYTVSSLFLFVYTLQGLSVAVFLMDRSKMSGVLKVILCLLLFIFLNTILFIIGVFEQFLHIRELLDHMKER